MFDSHLPYWEIATVQYQVRYGTVWYSTVTKFLFFQTLTFRTVTLHLRCIVCQLRTVFMVLKIQILGEKKIIVLYHRMTSSVGYWFYLLLGSQITVYYLVVYYSSIVLFIHLQTFYQKSTFLDDNMMGSHKTILEYTTSTVLSTYRNGTVVKT